MLSDVPIFIRSGHVVALNEIDDKLSIISARKEPFYLVIAFSCTAQGTCKSSGQLKLTNDLFFDIQANEKQLKITVKFTNSDDLNLICGEEATISNKISYAKLYGFSQFERTFDHEIFNLNINLCDVDLKNPILIGLQ